MAKTMDRKLVAAKQKHEIDFICKRYKVPKAILKGVIKEVGRSRAKIYDLLRRLGYDMPVKRVKKK